MLVALKPDYFGIIFLTEAALTLPIFKGYFGLKDKNAKIFENYLNPVMLVFIRLLSLNSLR